MEIKQVIAVRKDLNMRKGKLAAQVAHASLQVILDKGTSTKETKTWINSGTTKIVVSVNSEEELMNLYIRAQLAKLPHSLIQDAGRTEFKEPTYTAIAIGPAREEEIDKITGDLPLL